MKKSKALVKKENPKILKSEEWINFKCPFCSGKSRQKISKEIIIHANGAEN